MLWKKLKKANKGGVNENSRSGRHNGYSQPLPVVRSPALEAVERNQRLAQQSVQAEKQSKRPSSRRSSRNTRFAVEDTSPRPALQRKSLPRQGGLRSSRVGAVRSGAVNVYAWLEQRTGLTASWGHRKKGPIDQSGRPATPVQIISEEEQKKLAELEMSLPRVPGKIDSWLLVIVLALLCVGLVMIYSASSFVSVRAYGDASHFFQRQLLSAFLGVVALMVTMRIDYRHWRRFSLIGMAVILPMLVLVLFFGTNTYGASRWFTIGNFFSFQPSELTKLVLALYIADWLARKGKQVGTFLYGLAPFVILVGIILGLVLLENDMGTTIIIAALAVAMFFTAGANIIQFLLAMACGGLIFLTQAFQGYRYYRILGFLDPFKDITGMNLQLYQSLLGLGSGNWLGLGLGASRQKTGYLPFPFIDSIFAVIGEELGFIGSTLIVLLFLFLAFRGFRLARRTQDVYGALLATGITTWLVLQAMINIGASTGSIPYTGVPLPFISYGGTALIVSMAAVGILLNISRYTQEPDVPVLSKRTITNTMQFRKKS